MNIKSKKLMSIVLILCSVFIFGGCTDGTSNEQNNTNGSEETAVSKIQNDNPLIGTWQFVNENGENHTLLSYVFQDETTAVMAMGNVAYCSKLKLDKNENGDKTLTAQLYYNINGTYIYEISDDGKTMTLTEDSKDNKDNNSEKLIMKKTEDYQFMPQPPKNPEIEEKLIGKWEDKEGSGVTYTFYNNGTMENNSYDVMIIYAQFSAKDGKINITYNQGTEVKDSYEYSFNGEVLVIDGAEFIKQQ